MAGSSTGIQNARYCRCGNVKVLEGFGSTSEIHLVRFPVAATCGSNFIALHISRRIEKQGPALPMLRHKRRPGRRRSIDCRS